MSCGGGNLQTGYRLQFRSAQGIVRFLLRETNPFTLDATPVQIDPARPALPISHPGYYALYLAKLLGTFSTLGMAEDTWGRNEGALSQEEFLAQAASIQAEREAMFFASLDRTRRGVVACVFDTSDRVQHMCFGQTDVIEALYRDMDRVLGRAMSYVDERTGIFALSDHGFRAFTRGVNLNAWLRQEGYLTLNGDGADYFGGVDWARTRAYTFGLGGLYLNVRGREAEGIVEVGEAADWGGNRAEADSAAGRGARRGGDPCGVAFAGDLQRPLSARRAGSDYRVCGRLPRVLERGGGPCGGAGVRRQYEAMVRRSLRGSAAGAGGAFFQPEDKGRRSGDRRHGSHGAGTVRSGSARVDGGEIRGGGRLANCRFQPGE